MYINIYKTIGKTPLNLVCFLSLFYEATQLCVISLVVFVLNQHLLVYIENRYSHFHLFTKVLWKPSCSFFNPWSIAALQDWRGALQPVAPSICSRLCLSTPVSNSNSRKTAHHSRPQGQHHGSSTDILWGCCHLLQLHTLTVLCHVQTLRWQTLESYLVLMLFSFYGREGCHTVHMYQPLEYEQTWVIQLFCHSNLLLQILVIS